MKFENTSAFAHHLTEEDSLKKYRNEFYIPIVHEKEGIYFTGNSLGLQPKKAQEYVLNEMENWANYGTNGYHNGRNPWVPYLDTFPSKLAPILGALPEEIVVMNQSTINLHLLLTSFYRPTKDRYKIICEANSFPSDQYAIASHLQLQGYDVADALIEVAPRLREHVIRNEDILQTIKSNGDEVALVIMGGVHYFSGQVFDMKAITAAAHEVGALCGFDIAHAVGNIQLQLHDWDVDFACWCSYKYLNSGPGGVGGAFIHQRYVTDTTLPRLAGWWGSDLKERFQMRSKFTPMDTAQGWRVSFTSVLSLAVHTASLNIFEEAGFDNILKKGRKLSNYLLYILNDIHNNSSRNLYKIITPQTDAGHGAQISILMLEDGKKFFDFLIKNSVMVDWREPNVIRISAVPLYNTYDEVYQLGQVIKQYLKE